MRSLRLTLAAVLVSYSLQSQTHDEPLIPPSNPLFYVCAIVSFTLSCFSGVCSGLTVGYMSISKTQMQMALNSDKPQEKKMAKTILQILENHHLLLSTLLLSNSLALQALPIFLDKIVPSYLAVIISTIAVVIFGEVIPQSYATGSAKHKIGEMFAPFVKFLQTLLYVFVRPITYVLDNWLGHHEDKIILTPENLRSILLIHDKKQYGYRSQEIKILQNTANLRLKKIKNHMITLDQIFKLNQNRKIDQKLLQQLQKYNFSKIPVYARNQSNIVGFINIKKMISCKGNKEDNLRQMGIVQPILKLNQNLTLLDAIEQLKLRTVNFAIVWDEKSNRATGMITLKKIFEKLVLSEFLDDDNENQYRWEKAAEQVEGNEQD